MARPPPLLLLLLLMCTPPLALCSFPSTSSHYCSVECSPHNKCLWTQRYEAVPGTPPPPKRLIEEYTLTCDSTSFMRVDGSEIYAGSHMWECDRKKQGYWRLFSKYSEEKGGQTDVVQPEEQVWRKMKSVECLSELPCAPLVSSCRQGGGRCYERPFRPNSGAMNCTKRDDRLHVTAPGQTKATVMVTLECSANNGSWTGKGEVDSSSDPKAVPPYYQVPPGSNARCMRANLEETKIEAPAPVVPDSRDVAYHVQFTALLTSLFYLIAGLCWFIYASYYWARYVHRYGKYLVEQESLVPKPERTSFDKRGVETEESLAAVPVAHDAGIPTVPLDPEEPDNSPPEPEKGGMGSIPTTEKDAQAPNSQFHSDKEKAKKKKTKKKKEQISDEQYDSAVAMDKYYTKQDRLESKVEDFSEDDLEESWRKVAGPASAIQVPMGAGPSRHSKMSVKGNNNGTARGRLNSRAMHSATPGLSKRMADTINEETGGGRDRSRPRGDSRSRGSTGMSGGTSGGGGPPSGLLDSKAESAGTGF